MKVLRYSRQFLAITRKSSQAYVPKINRFFSEKSLIEDVFEKQNRQLLKNLNQTTNIDTKENANSDNEDTELNFESISQNYSNPKIQVDIKEMKLRCNGCGIDLQTTNQTGIGYVPEKKIQEFLDKSGKREEEAKDNKVVLDEDYQIIYEGEENSPEIPEQRSTLFDDYLESKKKLKKDKIFCERCFHLSNHNSFSNVDETKAKKYTQIVKHIDPNKLIDKIISKLPTNTEVFYIFDIFDMESTIRIDFLHGLQSKGAKVTFIANKYDVLPTGTTHDRIRVWVGERLKEHCKDVIKDYSYIVVSSKNGHNFDLLIHKIKKIKEKSESIRFPKIYIVGMTNVGKSTFINQLIEKSNRFKLKEVKTYNKDNPDVKIPFSSADLTSSPLPGTTIGISKVSDIHLGVKIFDTPGVPNKESIMHYMEEMTDIVSANLGKKIMTHSFSVKQGYSVLIGGIARIDLLNGDDKNFSFFFSHHVTIHRTQSINVAELMRRQYGKLLRPILKAEFKDVKMKEYEFNLKCDKVFILNYDINISGLGWFSISGKGFTQLLVSVPEGVKVSLREKPLMPFEIKEKGLKKVQAKTFNKNSKINRRFNSQTQGSEQKEKIEKLTVKQIIDQKKQKREANKNI